MGCAPSIHISESRTVYPGGREAEDAPGAAPIPDTRRLAMIGGAVGAQLQEVGRGPGGNFPGVPGPQLGVTLMGVLRGSAGGPTGSRVLMVPCG